MGCFGSPCSGIHAAFLIHQDSICRVYSDIPLCIPVQYTVLVFLQFFARPKVAFIPFISGCDRVLQCGACTLYTKSIKIYENLVLHRFPVGNIEKSKGVIKFMKLMYVACYVVDVSA